MCTAVVCCGGVCRLEVVGGQTDQVNGSLTEGINNQGTLLRE